MERAVSASGSVNSAKVVMDWDSGRSKGFGSWRLSTANEAAIGGLHDQDVSGREWNSIPDDSYFGPSPLAQPRPARRPLRRLTIGLYGAGACPADGLASALL